MKINKFVFFLFALTFYSYCYSMEHIRNGLRTIGLLQKPVNLQKYSSKTGKKAISDPSKIHQNSFTSEHMQKLEAKLTELIQAGKLDLDKFVIFKNDLDKYLSSPKKSENDFVSINIQDHQTAAFKGKKAMTTATASTSNSSQTTATEPSSSTATSSSNQESVSSIFTELINLLSSSNSNTTNAGLLTQILNLLSGTAIGQEITNEPIIKDISSFLNETGSVQEKNIAWMVTMSAGLVWFIVQQIYNYKAEN